MCEKWKLKMFKDRKFIEPILVSDNAIGRTALSVQVPEHLYIKNLFAWQGLLSEVQIFRHSRGNDNNLQMSYSTLT